MRKVYMDHAATSPVRPEVLAAMGPYFTDLMGNASSLHSFGQRSKRALEQSRQTVATAIGASPREVFFTAGGTASDNMAIIGAAYANKDRGKHLITSAIEHHAVLNTCHHLQTEGYDVTFVPVDRHGILELDCLKNSIRDDTIVISVILANNEVGTIEPVREIAAIAKSRGILLHTDAVQATGKIAIDVDELGVDLLSLTAHKFNGPKGTGALYIRLGTSVEPLLFGGHQERTMCPGTENIPGIVGLATALDLACSDLDAHSGRLAELRDRLEAGIRERIGSVKLNGHPDLRLPNILNMSFAHVEGESLLMALDTRGIAVSTGSACTAGSQAPSFVLQAMGLDLLQAQGSLRFSLGYGNDETDVDYVVDNLAEIVARLREMSPTYNG